MISVSNKHNSESGMAALMTVLIIGMAALTMVTVSSLIGIDEMNMSYSSDKGHEALFFAESCVDDALRKIKLNPDSVPLSFSLPIEEGSCIINMPDNATILSTGQAGDYVKHIQAGITINGTKVSVNDWQEE